MRSASTSPSALHYAPPQPTPPPVTPPPATPPADVQKRDGKKPRRRAPPEGPTAKILNLLSKSANSIAESTALLAPGGLPLAAEPKICRRCLVKGGFFKGEVHRCRPDGEKLSCRHCALMHKPCRPVCNCPICSSHAKRFSCPGRFGGAALIYSRGFRRSIVPPPPTRRSNTSSSWASDFNVV